ncbi:prepilin-type N-terminal cleavage/methylation domain-containing protein [Uliginosibacterium sp. H3]|uniref:Prepilin-type N-terminal cleavage/methylation domain-containing protein n=1 Tax=Uliginosibacterium silvisoli TaxID=3114758 RepID=A0ABU6JZR0_9RHOO|nr:prepilin-type N-terminal cleavage/methylation domain-containing protein [Uliginosibacterium sp. H3]
MMKRTSRGFTLIELMVTVAVIAILAAIAYPSYMQYVGKTRYAQAKEAAMQVGSALERKVAQADKYESSIDGLKVYEDQLSYTYALTSTQRGFYLKVTEKTARFNIWAVLNSKGTRCACFGSSCSEPTFAADTNSCPTGTTAF